MSCIIMEKGGRPRYGSFSFNTWFSSCELTKKYSFDSKKRSFFFMTRRVEKK